MPTAEDRQNEITYLNFLYNGLVGGLREAGGLKVGQETQDTTIQKDQLLDIARELVQ